MLWECVDRWEEEGLQVIQAAYLDGVRREVPRISKILCEIQRRSEMKNIREVTVIQAYYFLYLHRLDYAEEMGFYEQLKPLVEEPLQLMHSLLYS